MSALVGRKAVIAKLGMDAHWRGAIVVARALRDAGMEVVYIGHATAGEIVSTVQQEDAALIGLSTMSGNHMTECPAVVEGLRGENLDDVVLVVGGTISESDADQLRLHGVDGVFGVGSSLGVMVEEIGALMEKKRGDA